MAAMPQEKLLPLLPDLRDAKKIDGAVDQVLAAIQRKEAILTGYPSVNTVDRVRGVSETILEKRYPTEFEPPQEPTTFGAATPAKPSALVDSVISATPTAFETRNVGVTLEVEPSVDDRGIIRIDLVPSRVELLGFDAYEGVKTSSGHIVKADQPLFFTSKTTATVCVSNGQRRLIGVQLLEQPKGYMEVFILQAWAEPIPTQK